MKALFGALLPPSSRSPVLAKLPSRVIDRIAADENAAEVLTKIIQLGIVLFFSVLYASSPKLGSPDKQFITPTILAIYVILTTIGLVWAIKRPLPDWAVYLSTIFDMVLLYALIWSFHIIYDQPPSFYLKVPTLLYVFIFIAIRALRFEARFVIASGMTAAIGWIIMFAYVIVYDQYDNMITRDFVVYLTSNSILIGAEVDKIICILVVTAILAISINRARRVLVQAITEEDTASSLSKFFDHGVVQEIRGAENEVGEGEGVAREAAILNIDLRGFSKLAQEVSPEMVMRLLKSYQGRLIPIIQKHGGSIDKFLGDGILVSFGAVSDSKTCCADAMAAVEEILADYETWDNHSDLTVFSEDRLGLALTYGLVVFGTIGDGSRLELTVIGSTVNLTAKLEKMNKTLNSRAVISASAFDVAKEQGFKPKRAYEAHTIDVDGLAGRCDVQIVHNTAKPSKRRTMLTRKRLRRASDRL